MMSARWLSGAMLGISGILGMASGCSEAFDGDCKVNRTCSPRGGAPAAGESGVDAGAGMDSGGPAVDAGGAAGSSATADSAGSDAGAGGTSPDPVECSSRADCDDGTQCNGKETCEDGYCKAGSPPCENPDADNCSATCTEGVLEPKCTVTANDEDDDLHGSALCTAARGDDCDDAEKTVFKDAPELCDRLDNDCDGAADLLDGLTPVTVFHELGDTNSDKRWPGDVAWSEEKGVFGVVWRDDTSVMFMAVAPDGTIKVEPKEINTAHLMPPYSATAVVERPRIAAGNGEFGVVWQKSDAIGFRVVPASGVISTAVKTFAASAYSRPDIAYSSNAMKWAVAWSDQMVTITSNGTASAIKPIAPGSVGSPRIAALGNALVVTWGGTNGSIFLVSNELTNPEPIPLEGVEPTFPTVAAANDRFAVVTTPGPNAPAGSQPSLTAYDAAGAKLCGPVDIAASGLLVTDVVATASGYIVGFDYRYGFQEIGADCSVGPPLVKDTGVDTNYYTNFDGGGSGGYLTTALDPQTKVPVYRQFGPNFCD
jgi:hypothetical protein